MEQFRFTSHAGFDILKLRGDIKVGMLPALTPALGDHIAEFPRQHIVLDLVDVTALDSSIVKLFVNIQKRLAANDKKLFLLHTPDACYAIVKNAGLGDEIADIQELERAINENLYRTYLPYTHEEFSMQRLRYGCEVCGSKEVIGYLLDQNAYRWSWNESDFFPACTDKAGEVFDYFGALPIVCLDCGMTSIDGNHFNILNEKATIVRRSTLSESAKLYLTKSIKKRKKFMDSFGKSDTPYFFLYPRVRESCYLLYLMADSSIRTLALNKSDTDPFLVGYSNYIAIRYAQNEEKDELIDNCRTWITQAFNEKKITTHAQRAQAYFILFSSALTFNKMKEANTVVQDFSAMMDTISYSKTANSINSPHFWFTQIQSIWRQVIEKKSSALVKNAGEE